MRHRWGGQCRCPNTLNWSTNPESSRPVKLPGLGSFLNFLCFQASVGHPRDVWKVPRHSSEDGRIRGPGDAGPGWGVEGHADLQQHFTRTKVLVYHMIRACQGRGRGQVARQGGPARMTDRRHGRPAADARRVRLLARSLGGDPTGRVLDGRGCRPAARWRWWAVPPCRSPRPGCRRWARRPWWAARPRCAPPGGTKLSRRCLERATI